MSAQGTAVDPSPDAFARDRKQFLTLDGHRIAYLTAGDPACTPLLMVHGLMSHSRVWRTTVPALCDRYYCVAIDLLGFGDSDKPRDGDYGIEAQARRVLALADALGLERFALIGHSMGGQISLCLAALAPDRVVRLVDVAGVTSGALQPNTHHVMRARFWMAMQLPFIVPLFRAAYGLPALRRFEFRDWSLNRVPLDQWDEDIAYAVCDGIERSAYHATNAILSADLTGRLAAITAPALIIFGTADRVVPPSEGERAARGLKDARLVSIEGGGHFPMLERPDEYRAALAGFL